MSGGDRKNIARPRSDGGGGKLLPGKDNVALGYGALGNAGTEQRGCVAWEMKLQVGEGPAQY